MVLNLCHYKSKKQFSPDLVNFTSTALTSANYPVFMFVCIYSIYQLFSDREMQPCDLLLGR